MALTPSRILGPIVLGTSAADLLTVSGRNVLVRQAIVSNMTGSSVTARLSLTPSGGSIVAGALLPDETVLAHDVVAFDMWQVLAIGDKLNGLASVNPGVILTISGVLL